MTELSLHLQQADVVSGMPYRQCISDDETSCYWPLHHLHELIERHVAEPTASSHHGEIDEHCAGGLEGGMIASGVSLA
jgi:hypothetical protein